LKKCKSFEEIQSRCIELNSKISDLPHYDTKPLSEYKPRLQIHKQSIALIPPDFPNHHDLLPANVRADGDCLPHSGSLLIYDNQNHNNELRTRIVIELAIHKSLYLNFNHLRNGTTICDKQAESLPTRYTMFSELYTTGT